MSARRHPRSVLGPVIARYLELKQALGRNYANERWVLESIDAFLVRTIPKEPDLTVETFSRWCSTQSHLTSGVRRYRMRVVRNFCLYRRRTEPGCRRRPESVPLWRREVGHP